MGSHIMVRRLTQGVLRVCSGSAPACSPSTQVCSPSTQVKAAVAHVCRLKQNQRKRKLILSLWEFNPFTLEPFTMETKQNMLLEDPRSGYYNKGKLKAL
jgi:hypothetical protein